MAGFEVTPEGLEDPQMNDEFLSRLEDQLLGMTARPSLRQRLSTSHVPVSSIPKIVRRIGIRGLIESIRNSFVDTRSLYEEGRTIPHCGTTMIGRKRLKNIRYCIEQILRDDITGDFIETGVWRGGAAIYMRAVLKAHSIYNRTVWVADSFQGLPSPDPKYPADENDLLHLRSRLVVSQNEVESHFRSYGLLDSHVQFLPGWFEDSLKTFPGIALALLRIDCDLYSSTHTVLTHLHDLVADGGYVIVDDYGAIPACRLAVDDFRRLRNISDPIIEIDHTGIYWKRSRQST